MQENEIARHGEFSSTASIRKDLFPGFLSGGAIPKQYSPFSIFQTWDKTTQTDGDVIHTSTHTRKDLFPGFISGTAIHTQYSPFSIIQTCNKTTQTDSDVIHTSTYTTLPRKLISTRVITPQRINDNRNHIYL